MPTSFKDVKYLNDQYGSSTSSCPPPASDSCLNDASSLVYTVTYPKDHDYSACPTETLTEK